MAKVLVIGGGGYIGSHVVLKLEEAGHQADIFENWSNGGTFRKPHLGFQVPGVFNGNMCDLVTFYQCDVPSYDAIINLAGLIEVGESMKFPSNFYAVNVGGSLNVVHLATKYGIPLVYSSTCATFGIPTGPMDETHPQNPINPYGRSKLMVEQAIRDISEREGLNAVVLRYFNAAGADFKGRAGECHQPETHVLPLLIRAAIGGHEFTVFGTDYDTEDGTCVRDYVHVNDLADAHVKAVEYMLAGNRGTDFNLGSAKGYSVQEVISEVERVTNRKINVRYGPRREGDSPKLVAVNAKAKELLGWEPKHTLSEMVRTAYDWETRSYT